MMTPRNVKAPQKILTQREPVSFDALPTEIIGQIIDFAVPQAATYQTLGGVSKSVRNPALSHARCALARLISFRPHCDLGLPQHTWRRDRNAVQWLDSVAACGLDNRASRVPDIVPLLTQVPSGVTPVANCQTTSQQCLAALEALGPQALRRNMQSWLASETGYQVEARVGEASERIVSVYTEGHNWLWLDYRGFQSVPVCIGVLQTLTQLSLNNNRLTELPEGVTQLLALEVLEVFCNRLTYLPETLGCLSALRYLDVRYNALTCLPRALENCPKLTDVRLHGNLVAVNDDTTVALSALGVVVEL